MNFRLLLCCSPAFLMLLTNSNGFSFIIFSSDLMFVKVSRLPLDFKSLLRFSRGFSLFTVFRWMVWSFFPLASEINLASSLYRGCRYSTALFLSVILDGGTSLKRMLSTPGVPRPRDLEHFSAAQTL